MDDPLTGLFWSKDDAEKALSKHTFIRVSRSDKRSTRQMSGAERIWSQPETSDELYVVNFRISGKREDIEASLLNAGYSPEQVKLALEKAVTSENYQVAQDEGGQKEAYDREIEKLKGFKEEEKERKKREDIDWETLLRIASDVKHVHVVMKERAGVSPKRGKGKTFIDRFEEIRDLEGKMIDVSNMRDDGTRVVLRSRPQTERGQLVFISDIPIMSRTQEKYLRALEMLFNNEEFESEAAYQKVINTAQAKFAKKRIK